MEPPVGGGLQRGAGFAHERVGDVEQVVDPRPRLPEAPIVGAGPHPRLQVAGRRGGDDVQDVFEQPLLVPGVHRHLAGGGEPGGDVMDFFTVSGRAAPKHG